MLRFRYMDDAHTDPEREADQVVEIDFQQVFSMATEEDFKEGRTYKLVVSGGRVVGIAMRDEDLNNGKVVDLRR